MNRPHGPLSKTQEYQALADIGSPSISSAGTGTRRILWIDGVGGYLMLDKDDVLIGQATAGSSVDVGVVGDLSRQAAIVRRRDTDYLLQPLQDTRLNGNSIHSPQLLSTGDELQWSARVKIRFTKPHPLSATARLDVVSLHRFQPRVDGVLLLADSCILGPSASCHVRCPDWTQDLLMYRQGSDWYFRTVNEVDANGRAVKGQILISSGLRLRWDDCSLSIE
ncbi:MAG: hypothetical protein KF752_04505 [Pirellulaceae bacterium]|nr:hypothetical protein [Pirellulaceae bacterium]